MQQAQRVSGLKTTPGPGTGMITKWPPGGRFKWKMKEPDKGVKRESRVKEAEATGINQYH